RDDEPRRLARAVRARCRASAPVLRAAPRRRTEGETPRGLDRGWRREPTIVRARRQHRDREGGRAEARETAPRPGIGWRRQAGEAVSVKLLDELKPRQERVNAALEAALTRATKCAPAAV